MDFGIVNMSSEVYRQFEPNHHWELVIWVICYFCSCILLILNSFFWCISHFSLEFTRLDYGELVVPTNISSVLYMAERKDWYIKSTLIMWDALKAFLEKPKLWLMVAKEIIVWKLIFSTRNLQIMNASKVIYSHRLVFACRVVLSCVTVKQWLRRRGKIVGRMETMEQQK